MPSVTEYFKEASQMWPILMEYFIGKNSKNAACKEIRNLLHFRVSRPEPEDWLMCVALAGITWSWSLSLCLIIFLTFEQCQGYPWDHRSITEQMDATSAMSLASPGGTMWWSWQLEQTEGPTRAEDLRTVCLPRFSYIVLALDLRLVWWEEVGGKCT